MKPFKTTLHLWIVIASTLSFLVGWIMLAHAPKPIQPTQVSSVTITPLPTLPPIQFFNNGFANSTFQNSVAPNPQPNPQLNSGIPLLTTRGS
jgi:hypothetical protein